MSMPQERKLAGEVPGPGSRALEERRRRAVARGVATMTPVYAAAAHGAVLEDVDGNRFIDFTGGLGVLNAGHTPPSVVQAVKDQVERYLAELAARTMEVTLVTREPAVAASADERSPS